MARNRSSARQAGARFERLVADYLAATVDDRIDRRVQAGSADRGDVGGVRDVLGRRLVVECKDYGGRLQPAQWVREARAEAANDQARAGIVIAKRRGTTRPEDQWVLMDLHTLTQLITKDPQ